MVIRLYSFLLASVLSAILEIAVMFALLASSDFSWLVLTTIGFYYNV